MFAGIADHLSTKASPPLSSSAKTRKLMTIRLAVTNGTLTGRRDASVKGINPPTLSSSIPRDTHQLQRQGSLNPWIISSLNISEPRRTVHVKIRQYGQR